MTKMRETSSFTENLKSGDEVIVVLGSPRSSDIEKVDRVTKTQVILNSGRRFRRDNGAQMPKDKWSIVFLEEATPERVKKIRQDTERKKMIWRLTEHNWREMSFGDLRKVCDALDDTKEAASDD